MIIEIWSDIMCPFCYIGKRHLEAALKELPFAKDVDVVWKSYQLNPDYKNTDGENLFDYLAKNKGISQEQAKEMTGQVLQMASAVGLSIDFDKSVPANSFNAHQLIHFAASRGLQNEAEEALFKAHFIEGLDVDNIDVLGSIADGLKLNVDEAKKAINNNEFEEAVRFDIYESRQIGVRGVPFFVLNRKFALSGAQPVEAFKQAITQAYNEG